MQEDLYLHRAVIQEAKAGNLIDDEMPETTEEIMELAEYIRVEALEAIDTPTWRNNEHVRAIVEMTSGYETLFDPSLEFVKAISTPEELKEIESTQSWVNPVPVILDWSLEAIAKKANLPIPPVVTGEDPEMPRDITDVSDGKIRKLSFIFNNLMARAKWQLAVSTSDLQNATHLRDEAYRRALQNVERKDEETGKAKVKEIIDSEAKEDEEYRLWDDKVRNHQNAVTAYKALMEIYSSNCDRLSREMTYRRDAFEASRY